MAGKKPRIRPSDEDSAIYRHTRFSITLTLNLTDPIANEYAPAMTVEVDASKLFSEDELTNTDYHVDLARRMGAAFHTLAEKWKSQAPFIRTQQ